MKIVVTGGGGFVGSHVVDHCAQAGREVLAIDSFARADTLGQHFLGSSASRSNWEHISTLPGVSRLEADVRNEGAIISAMKDATIIVHTAGQVAVTSSIRDPRTDFDINVVGTMNVLEAARKAGADPVIVFCSTNKVYGDNVNAIPVRSEHSQYVFDDPHHVLGISEDFDTDHCHHTPYGTSKLAADLYVQEYGRTYGLRTGVFRMSCVYGTRQFGTSDQGWVSHFALSSVLKRPITIYGDGLQTRDVLFVDDLINAFDSYCVRASNLRNRVFNIGGGSRNTLSLLELLEFLEVELGRKIPVDYAPWRPADQRVYVSDIRRAQAELEWTPSIDPRTGVHRLLDWARSLPQ